MPKCLLIIGVILLARHLRVTAIASTISPAGAHGKSVQAERARQGATLWTRPPSPPYAAVHTGVLNAAGLLREPVAAG